MVGSPAPPPQVAVPHHGGHALEEVLHEPRAIRGCGNRTGCQQQKWKAILPKGCAHRGPRRLPFLLWQDWECWKMGGKRGGINPFLCRCRLGGPLNKSRFEWARI